MLAQGRTLACQFHPELSGAFGMGLIQDWLSGRLQVRPDVAVREADAEVDTEVDTEADAGQGRPPAAGPSAGERTAAWASATNASGSACQ